MSYYIKESNYELMKEAKKWIEEITKEEIGNDFYIGLKNGIILCKLINEIAFNLIPRIHINTNMPFKQMENISFFLKACRQLGVPEFELFETIDLYESKDLNLVITCLHALGRTIQKNYPNFKGPILGVKEATINKRTFTFKQLANAKNTVSKLNLGSSQTMERSLIDKSSSITLGADAFPSNVAFNMETNMNKSSLSPILPLTYDLELSPVIPITHENIKEIEISNEPFEKNHEVVSGTNSNGNNIINTNIIMKSPIETNISEHSPNNIINSSPNSIADSDDFHFIPNTIVVTNPNEFNLENSSPTENICLSPDVPESLSPSQTLCLSPKRLENSSTLNIFSNSPIKIKVGGYGLDAELAKKAIEKYDYNLEDEAKKWIEEITNIKFSNDKTFAENLKDGILLCTLMNQIEPNCIPKINLNSKIPFKQMENISFFLKQCRTFGVAEFDLFETVDLYEEKNLTIVVSCIHSLGRAIQKNKPEFNGPILGVKEALPTIRKKHTIYCHSIRAASRLVSEIHPLKAE